MFSGIIEATAEILHKGEDQLTLQRPPSFDDLIIGASIAVSGVCLSVVEFDNSSMKFDVVSETWDKSILGDLSVGDLVNLERSVLADSRLDGHVVQGHTEGVGEVLSMKNDVLSIRVPKELNKFFVQKGSIAINGVSLTLASVEGEKIAVALVPHTRDNTTLGSLKEGDKVNIETDIIGRYVYAFSHEETANQE